MREGKIRFAPTYKYEVGSYVFDQSKKKRAPSWTDRVLYKCNKGEDTIVQISYDSNNLVTLSDHRPVFSQFLVTLDSFEEVIIENFM